MSLIAEHGAHLGATLVPTALIGGYALVAEIRARRSNHRPDPTRQRNAASRGVRAAAYLSLLAGIVHVVVAPEHFHEATLYGTFFATSAGLQIAWAALVVRRASRQLLLAGLLGNAGIVLLWAVTRTVGIPLGPEAGSVEAVGLLDVATTLAEVGLACCAFLSLKAYAATSRQPALRST